VTATTDLVSEFVRAANSLTKLPQGEKRRLLDRGIAVSSALKELLIETGKVAPVDASIEDVIADIAYHIEQISDETLSKALLALAGQIRTLRIINREPA